jgi:hypothetical protein
MRVIRAAAAAGAGAGLVAFNLAGFDTCKQSRADLQKAGEEKLAALLHFKQWHVIACSLASTADIVLEVQAQSSDMPRTSAAAASYSCFSTTHLHMPLQ